MFKDDNNCLLRTCKVCGNKFIMQPDWQYITFKKSSKNVYLKEYYCSWSCLCHRKSGKLTVSDRKLNTQALKDYESIHKELMKELQTCYDIDKADELQDDLEYLEERINILEKSLERSE